jgi:hypothetical protein
MEFGHYGCGRSKRSTSAYCILRAFLEHDAQKGAWMDALNEGRLIPNRCMMNREIPVFLEYLDACDFL